MENKRQLAQGLSESKSLESKRLGKQQLLQVIDSQRPFLSREEESVWGKFFWRKSILCCSGLRRKDGRCTRETAGGWEEGRCGALQQGSK